MKRFSFRLQPILKYREYQERLARQETALALADVRESQARTDVLRGEKGRAADAMDRDASGGISASEYKAHALYLDSLDSDIAGQVQTTRKLGTVLSAKQKDLAKRSVARKVMERLKERRAREYMEEFRDVEQKTLDEIISVRKAREINNDQPD